MEGTRHEKVVLIIAAYVIGFTTAFIAFGLAKMHAESQVIFLSTETSHTAYAEEVNTMLASVAVSDEGLYLITEDGERLIAANRSVLGEDANLSAVEPGYYYEIVDAEASRDGRFVYYCEQLTQEAANCDPYVYALESDSLYRVKLDGQTLYPIIENHESMWAGNSTLMINGAVSNDENKPWELSTVEEVQVQ